MLQAVETANGTRHVWCTFGHDQIDLDFRNPEALLALLRIVRLHVDNGVRIIRLDAVAFLGKAGGTSSIHLPQTHANVQLMRLLCDHDVKPIILLTETNVPKTENLSYFGTGNEAHAICNFPLPPLILHAVMSGSADLLRRWQSGTPPAPMGCAHLNFTASHDGIGMRPVEGIPAFYIHSMLATPNDHAQVEHRGMNRAIKGRTRRRSVLGIMIDQGTVEIRGDHQVARDRHGQTKAKAVLDH